MTMMITCSSPHERRIMSPFFPRKPWVSGQRHPQSREAREEQGRRAGAAAAAAGRSACLDEEERETDSSHATQQPHRRAHTPSKYKYMHYLLRERERESESCMREEEGRQRLAARERSLCLHSPAEPVILIPPSVMALFFPRREDRATQAAATAARIWCTLSIGDGVSERAREETGRETRQGKQMRTGYTRCPLL